MAQKRYPEVYAVMERIVANPGGVQSTLAIGASSALGRRAAAVTNPRFREFSRAWEQFENRVRKESRTRSKGHGDSSRAIELWAVALREARSTCPYPPLA